MRNAIVLLLPLVLTSCGEPQKPPAAGGGMPAPSVGVAAPLQQRLPVVRELTGVVEAVATVDLRPRVSGVVERVLVKDGSEVKQGDPILEIDRQPFEAALRASEANLTRADALLMQAQQQLQRAQELLPQHAVSQQEFEDLQAAAKAADAQRAAADASLVTARLELGYTHVIAPISGRLGRIQTTVGNLVQIGQSSLTTIVSVDPVNIAFDLDERVWQAVSARVQAASAGGASVRVWAGIAGEPEYPHEGAVEYADNQIDPRSGSIRVRARFANAERSLMPGAFARVRFEVAPARPVLVINDQALQNQLAMRYVLVVGEHGVTQFRPVQLGEAVGDHMHVVVSGLGPDDRIVVSGLAKVFFPGMPVSPVDVSMADAGPAGGPDAGAPAAPTGAPAQASATSSAVAKPAAPAPAASDPKPATPAPQAEAPASHKGAP